MVRARERHIEDQAGAAGEIDHHARQRFVERHIGVAVAAHALLVAERLASACPSVMPTSSTVWCASMCRSPLRLDLEIDHAVTGDLIEHVIEETDAGGELGPAATVKIETTRIRVSRVLRGNFGLPHEAM